jgi:hypothetical protein
MTPEAALATLRAEADQSGRRRCTPITRRTVPIWASPTGASRNWRRIGARRWTSPAGSRWRKGLGQRHLRGADRGGEAVPAGAHPARRYAAWACLTGFVPDFDSWAIADAVAQAGQKRLLADPARLDEVEGWTTSDHMWTRRAALVFTLGFTKSRHPEGGGTGGAGPRPRLVRRLCRRSGLVHPEGRRLVGAGPVEKGPGARAGVSRGPRRAAEALGPSEAGRHLG